MTFHKPIWAVALACAGWLLTSHCNLAAAAAPASGKARAGANVKRMSLSQWTDQQIKKDLAAPAENGQFGIARKKLGRLEDQVIAYMPRHGLPVLYT